MTPRSSRLPTYLEDQPLDHLRVRDYTVKPSTGRKVVAWLGLGAVGVDGLGGDVSKWQENVDWIKAKAAGWVVVFVRGGYGKTPDSKFVIHWQGSKAVGLARGAYLYYKDDEDPEEQAEQLHALCLAATGEAGELPPTLDLEEYGNAQLTAWKVKKCLARLQELFGKVPIIYTGKFVWDKWIGNVPWAIVYPLWIAQYTIVGWVEDHINKVKLYPPSLPKPWTVWEWWQFTASAPAKDYGVSGYVVDLDFAAAGVFKKYGIGGSVPPPIIPPPVGGDMTVQAKITSSVSFNARAKATTNSLDVGDFIPGELVSRYPADDKIILSKIEEWCHLMKKDGTVCWGARWHPSLKGSDGKQIQAITDI